MILTVNGLSVDFATNSGLLQAVRGVSFDLAAGEVLGIVGESGSGKSVTAHSLMKLLPANGRVSSGSIQFHGDDVLALEGDRLRELRGRQIAMIFQEPGRSFDPIYTIGSSLVETIRTHAPEISPEEARTRAISLLEEVHVPSAESRLDNYPHQFSGGLLQRIMIAHALAANPEILIADEPTTALDVTIQAGIIQLLLELRSDRNLAIIFITHNLALISSFADRILVMYGGLVLEEGATAEVLARPKHPYTAGLLASLVPFGAHHSSRGLSILGGTPPSPLAPEPGCPVAPRCPLVREECRAAVPPIVQEEGSSHRCVVPGTKSAEIFARGET